MKLLILCPGKIPKSVSEIHCFTDVINYYLPAALLTVTDCEITSIPMEDNTKLQNIFSSFEFGTFDAIITLGLRYYSKISRETTEIIRSRYQGLLCQIHDGSRLDHDPVDITFTFKNDDLRLSKNAGWFDRHRKNNAYMGWAADPVLNCPNQDPKILQILVDHTNYGDNHIDKTHEVLTEIQKFVASKAWKPKWESVRVRRFDSGRVIDVDLNDITYDKYDRSKTIPFSEICKEHSAAHVFCVTHPESLGLVVLETAMAGAFVVSPESFIPKDRLQTVRHHEWQESIDWYLVLQSIDIEKSREVALINSWQNMATNILQVLEKRIGND